MSLLGNILWLIFGGFIAGLGYILGGLVICLTIIGIPFGFQAIKIGIATMAPFGKNNKHVGDEGFFTLIFNLAWLIMFGWEIAIAHIVSGCFLFVTIIGIPFAYQHFKLVPLALLPFGKEFDK
jgi:uncharacterized membrane protein YccF (DUF307 family)